MKLILFIAIYFIGLIICTIIFPKIFPYKEDNWEVIHGYVIKEDKYSYEIDIKSMIALWPIVICFMIILLPIKLIDIIFEYFHK